MNQKLTPLADALDQQRINRLAHFDVPAHKSGRGNPELTEYLGARAMAMDVNSMKPLDNLGHPVSVIKEAQQLAAEAASIDQKLDDLVTGFITENFDNVLGPGIFMMMTSSFQYPELTPWIEDIMSKATDNFKNDPYVKEYMEAAQKIQNMQNGLAQPDMPQPAAPQPDMPQPAAPQPDQQQSQQAPPTPNEMAKPAEQPKE